MFIIPYGTGCSDEEDSRMKRGNSKESSASRLARRGKRYYANIKDTYPCLYTVVLPVIRVTGWRSGRRGEFSTADKCDIAAAPRGEEEEIYIPFLFSREVAWTTRTERRISGQIERIPAPPPHPPRVSIPYRTCNFGERVFNARIFEADERHRSPRKLEGKSRGVWNQPRAKINTRRFTFLEAIFFSIGTYSLRK